MNAGRQSWNRGSSRMMPLVAAVALLLTPATLVAAGPQKGVLFAQHDNGFFSYRIPGLAVTSKGTVLAYCEARKFDGGDRDEIEIHLRRSTDGGRTFSPAVRVAHEGPRLPRNPVVPASKEKKGIVPDRQTVNNACAIADRNGPVHLVYCVEYWRCFYTRSDDDGVTWTEPREITDAVEQFKKEVRWQSIAFGPGHGIQLRSGRLLVPVWMSNYGKGGDELRRASSTVYSDDGGKTWQRGEIAIANGNEAQAAELSDGSVLLSARNSDPSERRALATSPGGISRWSKTRFATELLEPGCQAGLLACPAAQTPDGKPLLLFSNPPTTDREHASRANLSIRVSRDDGKTWPISKRLQEGPSAYSDLAVLPDGTILCLYESGAPGVTRPGKSGRPWPYANLTLARFDVGWLLSPDPAESTEGE